MRLCVLLLVFLFVPIAGYACSPVPRTAEGDAAVIERAAAVVRANVLSVTQNNNAAPSETIATAELEILEVYKGEIKKGEHVIVRSKNFGTCSRILSEGTSLDLLLFEEKGEYYLGLSTDYLFPETWARLKN